MAKRKILVVDDELQVCQLVQDILEQHGFAVTPCHTTDEAFAKMRNGLPDLIILDLRLPTIGGLEFCRQLKTDPKTQKIPVIMVTVQDTETDKVIGLEAGADDYLTKPFGQRELLARIKAIFRRIEMLSQPPDPILKIGQLEINLEMHEAKIRGVVVAVTPKEFDLLVTLVKNKNKALRRETLMASVWGYDYPGTLGTIDVHIRHLRSKLGSYGKYIKTLIGVGYRSDEKP
jgi:two-component system alkaline phosphatase synthesis response regulator PhoP